MKDFYKIPEEMAEKIRKESVELAQKHRSRVEEYDVYSNFVESQKKTFQENINDILDVLSRLIMEGKLYIHTKFVARIKDPESALHNDDIKLIDKNVLMGAILERMDESYYSFEERKETKSKKTGKALDDVFGITVITDTEEELAILKEELRKIFIFKEEKVKHKDGYHATHIDMYSENENEEAPLIECQLKTRQNYIQSYDHTIYKVESFIRRKLYKEGKIGENQKVKLNQAGINKVEQTIQEYYDDNRFNIFTNIPRMWEAVFNEETEQMELKALTEAQTLKRVYPSLVVRSDKIK